MSFSFESLLVKLSALGLQNSINCYLICIQTIGKNFLKNLKNHFILKCFKWLKLQVYTFHAISCYSETFFKQIILAFCKKIL